MQGSYLRLILIVDCALAIANILAIFVSVLYVTKLELYAGLPRDPPSSLPSYGLEVGFKCALSPSFYFFFRIFKDWLGHWATEFVKMERGEYSIEVKSQ